MLTHCAALYCTFLLGLTAGGVPHDEEGYVRGEGFDDEPAHVGGDVGRQGAGAGDSQAASAVDGEAAVQPHLPKGERETRERQPAALFFCVSSPILFRAWRRRLPFVVAVIALRLFRWKGDRTILFRVMPRFHLWCKPCAYFFLRTGVRGWRSCSGVRFRDGNDMFRVDIA